MYPGGLFKGGVEVCMFSTDNTWKFKLFFLIENKTHPKTGLAESTARFFVGVKID
jgi:hypothetical protein